MTWTTIDNQLLIRHLGRLSRTLPPVAHFQVYAWLRSVDPARDRDRGYTLTW